MITLWQPTAEINTLKQRARILQQVRAFFAARDVTEVQVPCITSSSVTETHIDSIQVDLDFKKAYLHTSPEYPMKRLLAAGMGDCYSLGSVFRQGESGGRHNPEFTMLEWYRLGFSIEQLSQEVVELVQLVLCKECGYQEFTYPELVQEYTGLDVFSVTVKEIRDFLESRSIEIPDSLDSDLDVHLDLLVSTVIFPGFSNSNSKSDSKTSTITVVTDYPESQAALAKVRTTANGQTVASRFEVFVGDVEIANGYQEIQDAEVLRQRFEADNRRRSRLGKSVMPIDEYLLDAMQVGLPECSGVALGVDRLLMLALNKSSIQEVIAFPFDRV